jgi:chlorophyllide a reductase subunit Z
VQEVCNGLFDALFHILPLGSDLDKVDPTPVRQHAQLAWQPEAEDCLAKHLETVPVLVRISAAKRLRDAAEARARAAGRSEVQRGDLEISERREPAPPATKTPEPA